MEQNSNQRTAIIVFALVTIVLSAFLFCYSASGVSRDRIDAYCAVDDDVLSHNQALADLVAEEYAVLATAADTLPELQAKLSQLRLSSDSMLNYISNLRNDLVLYVDGDGIHPISDATDLIPVDEINSKDDFYRTTFFMLGNSEGRDEGTPAAQLKRRLNKYSATLAVLVQNENLSDAERSKFNISTDGKRTVYGKETSWEIVHFDHLLLPSVLIYLDDLYGQVQMAELSALRSMKKGCSLNN